ncbi:hypothetical protein LXL04_028546 [Taraxacum kok-saghyz]
MSEAPGNDVENAFVGTIERKNPETIIVIDNNKEEEIITEEKEPKSYAQMVGKKDRGGNLFSIIKKDPNLKPGEVEMPVADILKGSEPFNLTLYGYFIEKKVNFYNMNKYALSKWRNYGIEETMVNEESFYFFRFSNEQGLKEVLEGGPWLVFDNPIIIRRWEPGLNLSKPQHCKIPVWVKIYNAPLEYWNGIGMSHIARELGKPLEADAWTSKMCNEHWGRPGFMRILMEMSAEKEWPKELNVYSRDMTTGERVQSKCKIEYAWTPSKCSHCKVFGHKDSNCGILIAMDLNMKEAKARDQVTQKGNKIVIIDELLKKTVPVKVNGDGFQDVIRKNKNWQKGENSMAGKGTGIRNKGQGQNGNYPNIDNNKKNYKINSGNGKGVAKEGGAGNNGSGKGNIGNNKEGTLKQAYVPKNAVAFEVSSNFDHGANKYKADSTPKIILRNKFDVLMDEVTMDDQGKKENANYSKSNQEDDDLLDENEETVEEVFTEDMEENQGDEVLKLTWQPLVFAPENSSKAIKKMMLKMKSAASYLSFIWYTIYHLQHMCTAQYADYDLIGESARPEMRLFSQGFLGRPRELVTTAGSRGHRVTPTGTDPDVTGSYGASGREPFFREPISHLGDEWSNTRGTSGTGEQSDRGPCFADFVYCAGVTLWCDARECYIFIEQRWCLMMVILLAVDLYYHEFAYYWSVQMSLLWTTIKIVKDYLEDIHIDRDMQEMTVQTISDYSGDTYREDDRMDLLLERLGCFVCLDHYWFWCFLYSYSWYRLLPWT